VFGLPSWNMIAGDRMSRASSTKGIRPDSRDRDELMAEDCARRDRHGQPEYEGYSSI